VTRRIFIDELDAYAQGVNDGAATERERIRWLAIDVGAGYVKANEAGYPVDFRPFADLLEQS
jgi:hypothetical protein